MPPVELATSFLAGSLLSILLPIGLLIAIAVWYVLAVKRVPQDTPTSSVSLPSREMVEAAGAAAVAEITPVEAATDDP
ncbi:MAG: hypothetical protein ACR2NR_21620 [Solirubrobacteraceae bacterium]